MHAVVRTDNMAGTDVRSLLVSVKYVPSDVATAIDNGNIVKLGALISGEREIYAGSTPGKTDALKDIVLVASPEVMYDERFKDLGDYENEAGKILRGYRLHSGDIFSVTAEALANATPAVSQLIELVDGTKLGNVGTATQGSTVIGKIIAKEVVGAKTFYVIKID